MCKEYDNPGPCVSVLIVSKERCLLGKRRETAEIRPGLWCLPCGYIEGGESFVEAAEREVYEETHLRIEVRSIINVVSNHFSEKKHSLVIVLLAVPVTDDEPAAGDDMECAGWYPLGGPYPELAFQADLHIIEQYIRYGPGYGIALNTTKTEFFEN